MQAKICSPSRFSCQHGSRIPGASGVYILILSDNYPAGKRVGDDLVGNLGNKDPASNLGDDPAVNSSPF